MKHHKLFWQSSYDRGLDVLLLMWKDIKKTYPDATLDITYGWNLFDVATTNNKERQEWKKTQLELMKQDGITEHGRVGKDKLEDIRMECGIWAYPTYFTEINCITALETQNDGLVPVTMNLGALRETAPEGVLIEGSIEDEATKKKFLEELLSLMGDKPRWKKLRNKCKKFAAKYDWSAAARSWIDEFKSTKHKDKVSIFTPSIRNGWWNVMASNIAAQTHKTIEWIIVDGQDKSRQKIADKYSKLYNLDIKYIHQGKTKRTYGLANANNLAINKATGYLFVFLQDFVLLTPTALEELLRVSYQHPGDFIAPVDNYFSPKIKPNVDNKEDWFDGSLDVIGEFMRKNVRIANYGVRKSEEETDFEHNFGAVPLSTLKALNGYWEFYDEALGWDDTEIIYRARALGYGLWIDDTNQCVCLDHFSILGKDEGGTSVNRTRRLNDPRYVWMIEQMKKGNLPVVRDPEIGKKIDLQYTIPKEISD
ncbi:MAG: glycosyltransferase, partial [Nitrosopumilus sp.]